MSSARKFAATAALAMVASLGFGMTGASADDGSGPNITHDEANGPSSKSSLVEVDRNNVGPFQVCNNDVPVNVLGVQVPFDQIAGAVGLLDEGDSPAGNIKDCDQATAQDN